MSNAFVGKLPGVPAVESPFFSNIFDGMDIDVETRRIANDLHEQGFAVFDFPDDDFDRHAEAIKKALTPRYDWETWFSEGFNQGAGLRVQDAWADDENVKRIAPIQLCYPS